jgi:glutamine synthetase
MTIEELERAGARAAALVLVDNAGIARMKCVPIERLERAAQHGVGWSSIWGLSLADDSFAQVPGLYTPSGDLRLRADLSVAVPLGGAPGWAWAPVDHREQSGEAWPGCQRWFLRRQVEAAGALGLGFQAAWELEWILGAAGGAHFEPLHRGPGYGAATFGQTGGFMLALLAALAESQLAAEQVHPEYAEGQIELSLPPVDPVRACDASVLARQVVRAVAAAHGLRASFSPRTVAGAVGNGAHVHVSLWRGGENQLAGGGGPEGLQPAGAAFVAGVLAHLPALTAIGAPSPLSYHRLQPSSWAGVYACWGNENREAALRLEGAGGPMAPTAANVEWKSVDGAANPYLALGAMLAAGLDGIERGLELPAPVVADPAELSAAERAAASIVRLPETLGEAAAALAESKVLRQAMGPFLHDRVVAVRQAEIEAATGLDEAKLVERYRWRF